MSDCRCGGQLHSAQKHEDDEEVLFCEACGTRYYPDVEEDERRFDVPMKFSTEMMDAIEEGHKTQTRRPLHDLHPRLQRMLPGDVIAAHDPLSMQTRRLRLNSTRIEHIQDISEEDAQAEGWNINMTSTHHSPRVWFRILWATFYGNTPGKRWGDNPVVKVYDFTPLPEE